jgi:hypothetical protein
MADFSAPSLCPCGVANDLGRIAAIASDRERRVLIHLVACYPEWRTDPA